MKLHKYTMHDIVTSQAMSTIRPLVNADWSVLEQPKFDRAARRHNCETGRCGPRACRIGQLDSLFWFKIRDLFPPLIMENPSG